MMHINTPADLVRALREQPYNFTSFGCYTLMYVHNDGACSHPACARKHALSEARKVRDGDRERITCLGPYYEGPAEQCVFCNEPIESSYGDPEESADE